MLKSTLVTIFFGQNGPFKEFITKNMQRLNCRVPLNVYGAEDDDDAVAKDIQMKGGYDFLGEKLKIFVWEVLYASTTILTPDKSFSELTAGFGG